MSDEQTLKATKISVVVIGILAGVFALNPPALIIQLTTFTTSVTAATFEFKENFPAVTNSLYFGTLYCNAKGRNSYSELV